MLTDRMGVLKKLTQTSERNSHGTSAAAQHSGWEPGALQALPSPCVGPAAEALSRTHFPHLSNGVY